MAIKSYIKLCSLEIIFGYANSITWTLQPDGQTDTT